MHGLGRRAFEARFWNESGGHLHTWTSASTARRWRLEPSARPGSGCAGTPEAPAEARRRFLAPLLAQLEASSTRLHEPYATVVW